MATGDPKRKTNRKGRKGAGLLAKLDDAEAASVLQTLLERHHELRSEAEEIAADLMTEISPDSVAVDVENALLQYDYDDLNSRAGGHSWGYVEPSEAAWELLQEALEPFISEMKRYLEMGLEDQARQHCQGILLGLHSVRGGGDNDVLGWAPDFPEDAARDALKVWTSATGTGGRSGAAKRKPRTLPPGFVREQLPGWERVLKSGGED